MNAPFGQALRRLRLERGLSQAKLGRLAYRSGGYISELELGKKQPGRDLAKQLDTALAAGGTLIAAAGERAMDMHRRTVLTGLALAGITGPLAASEATRDQLAALLAGSDRPDHDADEWQQAAIEYGHAFYTTRPADLVDDLTADLANLQTRIAATPDSRRRPLYRACAQLAAITAVAWTAAGQTRHARSWWHTARSAADACGDIQASMFVRGWEVTNGLYSHRPIPVILDRAAEATTIGGQHVCAGTAGMYAGLAQTLAVAGRHAEATQALRQAADITDQIPAAVAGDDASMHGWPEVRLRHTESYVHTALGNTAKAYAAQDRALDLYPPALQRERAAMLLHRATCLIHDGDIAGGLRFATNVLDGLHEQATANIHTIGRQTLAAVPVTERARPDVADLAERLTPAAA